MYCSVTIAFLITIAVSYFMFCKLGLNKVKVESLGMFVIRDFSWATVLSISLSSIIFFIIYLICSYTTKILNLLTQKRLKKNLKRKLNIIYSFYAKK